MKKVEIKVKIILVLITFMLNSLLLAGDSYYDTVSNLLRDYCVVNKKSEKGIDSNLLSLLPTLSVSDYSFDV